MCQGHYLTKARAWADHSKLERHSSGVVVMLAHRLRRCSSIKTTPGERLEFSRMLDLQHVACFVITCIPIQVEGLKIWRLTREIINYFNSIGNQGILVCALTVILKLTSGAFRQSITTPNKISLRCVSPAPTSASPGQRSAIIEQ